jgi:hypothetical protein
LTQGRLRAPLFVPAGADGRLARWPTARAGGIPGLRDLR